MSGVTPEGVAAAADALRAQAGALRERPAAGLSKTLGAVGARFLDSGDPLRTEALDRIPEEGALSAPMARTVLDGMAADWSEERLLRMLRFELGDPACLDGVVVRDGRRVMAVGPALCVQIVSGSVPGVGVHALLRSLLVKAPTLLKPGRGDAVLPELFARGLAEVDGPLADALRVMYWAGGSREVEAEALARAEVAVVYGADATVRAVRAATPATTRVVGYHHRVGVAVIGRGALTASTVGAVAHDTALAVALFEQRGCVCPHSVYVESAGEIGPEAFATRLADALADLEESLPSAPLGADEGGALHQLRGTAELTAASGNGLIRHGGPDAPWTVIVDPPGGSGPPTLARGVRVRPIGDATELATELAPLGPHLQSVGHAGLGARLDGVARALGRAGASRVVPLRALSFPPPWWLHDGRGPLRELVRWLEVELD